MLPILRSWGCAAGSVRKGEGGHRRCSQLCRVMCPQRVLSSQLSWPIIVMKLSAAPRAAVALGLLYGVESFVTPFLVGQQHRCSSAFSTHMIRRGVAPVARSGCLMMGGFGEPVKKKKAVGVGRGQEAYQRQVKSYNGLTGAGAEGTDIYVHREVSMKQHVCFRPSIAGT